MKCTLLFLLLSITVFSQGTVQEDVLAANEAIDKAVVQKDIDALRKLYADDFIFTHGTGTVDDKASWMAAVAKPQQRFVSRVHDSTEVEMHRDIAIVKGRLSITRLDAEREVRYGIWYIRVFRRQGKAWQLISHRTTKEWHY